MSKPLQILLGKEKEKQLEYVREYYDKLSISKVSKADVFRELLEREYNELIQAKEDRTTKRGR